MKTIVAGGRDFDDYSLLWKTMYELPWNEDEIVSGAARGADAMGESFANAHDMVLTKFPAKWDELGKRAGFVRNAEMADYADALVAFWDGKSRGTKHMIDQALTKGLYVFVVPY